MNTASGIFVAPAPAELAARRKVIYQQVITALDGVLEWEPGHPLVDRFVDSAPASPDKRCRYSMAFAYLAGDERQRQKGAALLEATELPTFDNHAVAILATLLKVHGSQLPAQTRALLLERLARYAAEAGTEDFRVQGFNDNAPMHCLTTLLFAGDLLGNRALAKLGLERLRDAVAMLERRGVLGEMNSPTYTAWSLTPLACLAQWCADAEAKALAAQAARKLVAEILLFYHRELQVTVAPYSRSYSDDLDAHITDVQWLLTFWLGDRAPWQVRDAIQPDSRLRTHGTWQFFLAMLPYKVTPDYPVDSNLCTALNEVRYPFEISGRCEHGSLGGGHVNAMPAGASPFYSYRTATLALGSFESRGWPEAHLHAVYQRRTIPAGARGAQILENIRTLYYAGRADDEPIFAAKREPEMNQHQRTAFLRRANYGSAVVLQDKHRAVVAYCQRLPQDKRVCTVGLNIVLPTFFGPVDEIWADDDRLDGGSGTFTHFPTFHVRDGETFIRIIPLLLPHHNVHYLRATGVEHVEHYQLIALYNVTAFQPTPPPGDGCWHNGFFLEFGHAATDGSFAEFRQRRAAIAVSDSLGHARERRIRVTGPDFDLALAADSYTATVRYATANGVERNAARLTTSDNALNAALDCS